MPPVSPPVAGSPGASSPSISNTARLGQLSPTLDQVRQLVVPAEPGTRTVPLTRTIMADMETPVSAYLKIAGDGLGFILESIEGGERLARYSFIGGDPLAMVTLEGSELIISSNDDEQRIPYRDPLDALQQLLDAHRGLPHPDGPRFMGGLVGYLSYEAVRAFEPRVGLAKGPGLGLPDGRYLLVDRLLVFDNLDRTISAVSQIHLDDGPIELAYERAAHRLDELLQRLQTPVPPLPHGDPPVVTSVAEQRGVPNTTPQRYHEMVQRAKDYIAAGDIIQVVLSQRVDVPTPAHPLTIYRALRSINPAPYLFYLNLGDHHVVGASPELLVRLEGRTISNHPIAGTRPRGATPAQDEALAAELISDPKERAEHIMLVDLGRNDVGRVARPGTVRVPELMEIEKYSQVMHLVSHVEGELADGLTGIDALRSCFPAGTVSGAPKIRAMEIIAELEGDRRGPYAGALGYFDFAGGLDTAITLRTMVYRNGVASIQGGGGIVADSIPENEFAECFHKMRALQRAIELAEALEVSETGGPSDAPAYTTEGGRK